MADPDEDVARWLIDESQFADCRKIEENPSLIQRACPVRLLGVTSGYGESGMQFWLWRLSKHQAIIRLGAIRNADLFGQAGDDGYTAIPDDRAYGWVAGLSDVYSAGSTLPGGAEIYARALHYARQRERGMFLHSLPEILRNTRHNNFDLVNWDNQATWGPNWNEVARAADPWEKAIAEYAEKHAGASS